MDRWVGFRCMGMVLGLGTLSCIAAGCLPNAFDKAERAEREREAARAQDGGVTSDSDPVLEIEPRRGGSAAAGGTGSGSAGAGRAGSSGAGVAGARAAGNGSPAGPDGAGGAAADGGITAGSGAADGGKHGGAGGGRAGAGGMGSAGSSGAGGTSPRAGSGGAGGRSGGGGSGASGGGRAGTGGSGASGSGHPGAGGGAGQASACGDTQSSVKNCGMCGNDCSAREAQVACVLGECARSCGAGRADCNGDLALGLRGDGCETETGGDLANCGACGATCQGGEGAVSECAEGQCAIYRVATGAPSTVAGLHGTPDGGTAYEQICGAGMALVGLDAASDAHALSGFAPLCAPLRLDGTPGQIAIGTGEVQALMALGNRLMPQPITRLSCPGDHIVSAVHGAEGLIGPQGSMFYGIQQLTLDCARVSVEAAEHVVSNADGRIDIGSLDGTAQVFSDVCPAGQVVAGFTGGADGIIDRLQTSCTPLTVTRQTSD